ncbi:protein kinase domain-containing protein, partial [Streptomyces zhihengii]|uniref:protein kinase domain-containing protein n=1 Tax=Streptomyces zhihengii TaxID=1818004 RepID=UPI0033B99C8B
MSEAEQARGPQRNEAEGAGSAGRGEDSAGDERMSGTADGTDAGTAPGAGAVTAAQDTGRDAEDARGEAGTGRGEGSAAGGTSARGEAPAGERPSGGTPGEGASGKDVSGEGVSGKDASDRSGPAEGATAKDPSAKGPSGRAASAKAAPAAEERLLAGRYRLGGVLGRGGMGTVWRAVDETLGRTVAVKELRFPNAIDEDEKRRLITRTLREAKAIARIRNNSAVTVFDVVDEDDRPWIVMELVEGKSLAEVVREDGVLTPRRAAEVGLAILDVLRSAHREGILHRDVKPSNVLIGKDGRVVLTDFGIAQVEGDPSITSTGMLVGAPSYISPERARGHKPGPAADLWSLGGLLYASVEGSPPYDKGSAIATLTAVMTEPLDPPKNAGPLEEVIYGLLAKDPAQRLDDAGARAMLTRVVNAPAEPETPAEPEPSPEQTRVIMLPPAPPAPPAAPARPVATPKDPAAADRVRGALRSVRNAAAAAKAENRSPNRT